MTRSLPESERFCDVAAEAATLASMIIGPQYIPEVLLLLDRSAFFAEEHKLIFDAILGVYHGCGADLDGVLVRSELTARGQLDQVGGVEYLQNALDRVPTPANAAYYARQVAERKRYRDLLAAHEEIGKVVADHLAVDDQILKVQQVALGLQPATAGDGSYAVAKHATRVALLTQEHKSFIPTGFRNLDYYVGGLTPGRLVIAAARPSMGKTALAVGIALNLAQMGKRILYLTLEMTADELMERMISVLSGVNLLTVKRANPDKATLDRFYQASLDLEKLPVVIEEGRVTVEQQVAAIRRHAQAGGVDAVFVDYIGLMMTGRRIDNRVQEVSTISRQLKLAAIREHVPIVALSQLNRECENRENHRPRLSDLRDSGSLEQDADVVMLLHREDYYRRQKNPNTTDLDGVTECIIAKQRGGPCGVAKFVFIEETTKFGDLTQDEIPI
jgi:replicative DNA helicase